MDCYGTPREHRTPNGTIRYWVTPHVDGAPNLVFLPGLTADHRLFDKQIEHFAGHANCLIWDPPSHGASRPFALSWDLDGTARWLHEILDSEGFERPVLVGQSMGGFLSQVFLELFPGEAAGFVAIDSAPMGRTYYQRWELFFLRHTHGMYASIPWKWLLAWGSNGCATSTYGRTLMRRMMESYNRHEYVDLAAHGYQTVAKAVEAERAYEVTCPALILCGTKDRAGSSKRYSRTWAARSGIPLQWLEGAGHNSNTDVPDEVNAAIDGLLEACSRAL